MSMPDELCSVLLFQLRYPPTDAINLLDLRAMKPPPHLSLPLSPFLTDSHPHTSYHTANDTMAIVHITSLGVAGQTEEGQTMRRQKRIGRIVEAKMTEVKRKRDRVEENRNMGAERWNSISRSHKFFFLLSEQNKRLFWCSKCGFHTADWKASGQIFSETELFYSVVYSFNLAFTKEWEASCMENYSQSKVKQ